jgi:hypothetical protein
VVLLWRSPVFRPSDKLLGTLVLPGGIAGPLIVGLLVPASSSTTCVSSSTPTPLPPSPICITGNTGLPDWSGAVLALLAAAAVVLTALRLARRVRTANAANAAS